MNEQFLETVGLLKIDVEGYEEVVLRGAAVTVMEGNLQT